MKPAIPLILLVTIAIAACSSKDEAEPPAPTTESSSPETTQVSEMTETADAAPSETPGAASQTPEELQPEHDAPPPGGHVSPQALTQAFIDQQTAAARAAVKALATALKSELKTALQDGGPINALSVCHDKASPISRQVSTAQGMKISRVSLKNRNPSNEAVGWTQQVLEDFEADKQAGKDVGSLEFTEIVEINGQHQFRYMKAIPTGKVCLTCHGANLSPEVREKLHELYPADKATGFDIGDIRGAFVVTKPL